MDTTTLLQRCKSGDPAAVESLVQTYQDSMFRLALLLLGDPAEAEEAVQTAFLSACRALDTYQGNASLRNWLLAIVTNESRNRLRKWARIVRLKEQLAIFARLFESPVQPEKEVIQREEKDAVWKAIQTLGEKHRVPVILRYYQDLSVAEISQILGISEGTVHSRLNTARERLRTSLGHLKVENYE